MRAITSPQMSSSHPQPIPQRPALLQRTLASVCPSPANLVTSSPAVLSIIARLYQAPPFGGSYARLLQLTDQLFVANLSKIETTGGRTASCTVQCKLPSSSVCQDPCSSKIRDLVASFKTTIGVLEAELECFKAETVKRTKTYQSDSEKEGHSHDRHLYGLVRAYQPKRAAPAGQGPFLTVNDSSLPCMGAAMSCSLEQTMSPPMSPIPPLNT
ncbi:hypothetical protein J6590_072126 [Homalodisca vitripennis]|nr:hypothetical protein J6590_072126 [Homalodisca vitripennis]